MEMSSKSSQLQNFGWCHRQSHGLKLCNVETNDILMPKVLNLSLTNNQFMINELLHSSIRFYEFERFHTRCYVRYRSSIEVQS